MIEKAHYGTLAIQADWARMNGTAVAAAASLHLISTENGEGHFGRVWFPTQRGLAFYHEGVL